MVVVVVVIMHVPVLMSVAPVMLVCMVMHVVMIMAVGRFITVAGSMRVSRCMQIEARKGCRDHRRIKMATLAGIDLYGGGTRRAYPVCVVGGLLVTLDDGQRRDGSPLLQRVDGCAQQGGFSGSGT